MRPLTVALRMAGLVVALAWVVQPAQAAQQDPGGAQGTSKAALKTFLTPQERGEIAALLVTRFASDVRAKGGDVLSWSKKLGKAIGLADAINAQRAAQMPTLNTAMAVLMGQPVDSSSVQKAIATASISGPVIASLGDAEADLTYTPLPHGRCRVADSRVINSALPASTTRDIDVEDIGSYAAQGGNGTTANGDGSTNCGIPSLTAGMVVSVSLLPIAPSGFFKIFSGDQVYTDGNTVQWATNTGGITNDVIVRSCQSCALELRVWGSGQTHYVVDVLGYFMKPQATALDCADSGNTTVSVAAGGTANVVAPACSAGYTATTTNCESGSWQMPFVYQHNGTCSAQNNGGSSAELRASRTCCRVPGR